jgi:uncharacterized protein YbjT (DUF2867 family)
VTDLRVVLFGSAGRIGGGALARCLEHPRVRSVLAVDRLGCGAEHPKLRELVLRDFLDYSACEDRLEGFDTCFYCIGTTSLGVPREEYRRITCEFPAAAGSVLCRLNPGMAFVLLSSLGADPEERSPLFWARMKGRAEKTVQALPFRSVSILRPGLVGPRPWVRLLPALVTTAEAVGLAMIHAAFSGSGIRILGNSEINALAERSCS